MVHQFPNGTTLGAGRTIGPAGRPAGRTASRAAGRTTGSLAFPIGRPAGRFPSRRPTGRGLIGLATVSVRPGPGGRGRGLIGLASVRAAGARGRGPFGLAHPYPDLRSFGFGDEVIEEKAVLLLFEVEVVELNEEW